MTDKNPAADAAAAIAKAKGTLIAQRGADIASSVNDIAAERMFGKKKTAIIARAEATPEIPKLPATSSIKDNPNVVRRTNQFFIDPKSIDRREGWNPRFDYGEIEELAESIRSMKFADPSSGGLLNDIRVKRKADGRFELVDGDRRMTAIESLLKKGETFPLGIPAKVEKADADDTELLIRMFTANTGKQFLPMEQAVAFKRMKDAGMTLKDIEQRTGASDNTIVGALALLDADDSLKNAVTTGKLKGTIAKSIAVNARGDKAKQAELTKEAVEAGKDKKKVAAVKSKIDDARRAKAAKTKPGLKLKMRALTNDQLKALGTKMGEHLATQLETLGMAFDSDLVQWLKDGDNELRLAYTFGVLQALKASAGVVVPLVL